MLATCAPPTPPGATPATFAREQRTSAVAETTTATPCANNMAVRATARKSVCAHAHCPRGTAPAASAHHAVRELRRDDWVRHDRLSAEEGAVDGRRRQRLEVRKPWRMPRTLTAARRTMQRLRTVQLNDQVGEQL